MKLVRYDNDVYQILNENGTVAYQALRLANGKWSAYDSNDVRLTKQVYDTPRQVLAYIARRNEIDRENTP